MDMDTRVYFYNNNNNKKKRRKTGNCSTIYENSVDLITIATTICADATNEFFFSFFFFVLDTATIATCLTRAQWAVQPSKSAVATQMIMLYLKCPQQQQLHSIERYNYLVTHQALYTHTYTVVLNIRTYLHMQQHSWGHLQVLWWTPFEIFSVVLDMFYVLLGSDNFTLNYY